MAANTASQITVELYVTPDQHIAEVHMVQVPNVGELLHLNLEYGTNPLLGEPIRTTYLVTKRAWEQVRDAAGGEQQICLLTVQHI